MNFKYSACLFACSLALALPPAHAQTTLPEAVKVPDGHRVLLETVGVGEITYECRDKANTPVRPNGLSSAPRQCSMTVAVNRWATTLAHPLPGRPRMARKSPAPSWQWHRRTKAPSPINWSRPTRPKAKAPCRGQLHPAPGHPRRCGAVSRLHGAEQRCQAGRPVPG